MSEAASFVLSRPPQNDDELYELVWTLWGVRIPRVQVCPDHCSPFDAFAEAYFGRVPVSVWVGSRGFGGKSRTLAYLTLTEAVVLGAECNLLGGSFEQSRNIHEAMRDGWDAPLAPRQMVVHHGAQLLRLSNGAKVRPLTASQRTVRGPHPQRLRLDEIDEMDITILDAAMGQPMPKNGIDTQTVMSSTWQYPDKTMTEMVRRAGENGWPVRRWCVAEGSLVVTARGEVPIQEVTNKDLVLTRKGWRHVQHVTLMGYKPTISLKVGDRTLRCTPDHLIATPSGWSTAHALAADAMASIGSDVSVLGRELVSSTAVGRSVLVPPRSGLITASGDQIKMFDIDTRRSSAHVIGLEIIGDRTDDTFPDPSSGVGTGPSFSVRLANPLDAVTSAFSARPINAVSGEHRNNVAVYDIGVEGDAHEFIAEGIVVHNCYLETSNPIDGWLAPETIDRKRTEVSKHMFEVEYDLQEPSVGNRAIDTESVEKMFSYDVANTYTQRFRKDVEQYVFEEPDYHGDYVIAADWAKEVDRTVISVWRHDEHPHRLVAFWAGNRMPYPRMIAKFDQWLEEYGARGIHDATGLGGVVADTLEARGKVKGFLMSGRARDDMLSEYIAAIERNELIAPRVSSAYSAHKYASVESVYGKGKDNHLPDEICSFALAWHLMDRGKRVKPKPIIDIVKEDGSYWRNTSVSTLPRL